MNIKNISMIAALLLNQLTLNVAFASENKYLCITDVSSGIIFKHGAWKSTSFKNGVKYLLSMENGNVISVKPFGSPDEFIIKNCQPISTSSSYVCSDNFDSFRFQKSTKRFVVTNTSGYTSEYEELGVELSPTSLFPNISIGLCESL